MTIIDPLQVARDERATAKQTLRNARATLKKLEFQQLQEPNSSDPVVSYESVHGIGSQITEARNAVRTASNTFRQAKAEFATLVIKQIKAWLLKKQPIPRGHSDEIKEGTGISNAEWNAIRNELKKAPDIRTVGKGRGAWYILTASVKAK